MLYCLYCFAIFAVLCLHEGALASGIRVERSFMPLMHEVERHIDRNLFVVEGIVQPQPVVLRRRVEE